MWILHYGNDIEEYTDLFKVNKRLKEKQADMIELHLINHYIVDLTNGKMFFNDNELDLGIDLGIGDYRFIQFRRVRNQLNPQDCTLKLTEKELFIGWQKTVEENLQPKNIKRMIKIQESISEVSV
jgi:hypothetical protein